jgi:hypothetical protein
MSSVELVTELLRDYPQTGGPSPLAVPAQYKYEYRIRGMVTLRLHGVSLVLPQGKYQPRKNMRAPILVAL